MALGMRRWIAWMAALGLGLAPAAAWAQERPVPEKPTVRVAVEGAYPPFNYIEQDELQGFEVDLLKALCEIMAVRCQLVIREWEGIVRGLINREYDAIMSSLEVTERRRRRIAFSRRYYFIRPALIGPKDATLPAVTPQALAGKAIGAVDRSEHARYVEEVLKGAELRVYGKLEEANLDLLAGRIDFVMGDKLSLFNFLGTREGECCRFIADVPENPVYHGEGYAVGLRKEDTALKDAFDRAIAQAMADGTYDRIQAKYFKFDVK